MERKPATSRPDENRERERERCKKQAANVSEAGTRDQVGGREVDIVRRTLKFCETAFHVVLLPGDVADNLYAGNRSIE
jgi:hypothetical protein